MNHVIQHSEKHQKVERLRRWNTTWLGRLDSYLLHLITLVVVTLFMYIFQRTRVFHRERMKQMKEGAVIVPNHVSMLDDFFLGGPILGLKGVLNYKHFPYHAPEEKNFFKGKILSYFMRKLKCVPLTRGAGFTQPGMLRLIELAEEGNILWIYPEGGRTRTGDIQRGKAGVGLILYRSRSQAIPVYHHGLQNILPIGKQIPRLFRKVDIIVGNPVPLDDLFELPDEPRTWQAIADRIIEHIKALREELSQITGRNYLPKPRVKR
ncbi:MAG: 1-acyl-sn-glycerol-3-phosphate acyltransferase [bacterium]|nr:1-acyl-sn-glycerol-3-phosphate acyltransferase [bacterium]